MLRVTLLLISLINASCSPIESDGNLLDGAWQCQRTTEYPGVRTEMQGSLTIDLKSNTFSETLIVSSSYEDGSNVILRVKGGGKIEVGQGTVTYHLAWFEAKDESGRMSASILDDMKASALGSPKTVHTVSLTDTEWVISSREGVGEVVCKRSNTE